MTKIQKAFIDKYPNFKQCNSHAVYLAWFEMFKAGYDAAKTDSIAKRKGRG